MHRLPSGINDSGSRTRDALGQLCGRLVSIALASSLGSVAASATAPSPAPWPLRRVEAVGPPAGLLPANVEVVDLSATDLLGGAEPGGMRIIYDGDDGGSPNPALTLDFRSGNRLILPVDGQYLFLTTGSQFGVAGFRFVVSDDDIAPIRAALSDRAGTGSFTLNLEETLTRAQGGPDGFTYSQPPAASVPEQGAVGLLGGSLLAFSLRFQRRRR